MLVWRLVRDGFGTLTEIEQHWNFTDIMKAKAVAEYEADLQYLEMKRAKGPKG